MVFILNILLESFEETVLDEVAQKVVAEVLHSGLESRHRLAAVKHPPSLRKIPNTLAIDLY